MIGFFIILAMASRAATKTETWSGTRGCRIWPKLALMKGKMKFDNFSTLGNCGNRRPNLSRMVDKPVGQQMSPLTPKFY